MFNVGNTTGYKQGIPVVEAIYKNMVAKKAQRNDSKLNETFKPLDEAYTAWIKAITSADKAAMNTAYNNFMNAFPMPYMASF